MRSDDGLGSGPLTKLRLKSGVGGGEGVGFGWVLRFPLLLHFFTCVSRAVNGLK